MHVSNKYIHHLIRLPSTAREALKALDQLPDNELRVLLVVEGEKMVGTLTDGDIRRGLLANREISEDVSLYMHKNFRSLTESEINPENLRKYREADIWFLPVLNETGAVSDVINLKEKRTVIPAAAVIMAGGRGERLKPLTDTIPKPMLRIGNKPIIELNIDRLISFGVKDFYISIKYLGDKIIEHLGDGSAKGVSIQYLREEEPLGTLGSCSMIGDTPYEQLLVMNSDVLTNVDFEDMFNFYHTKEALMCAASVPYVVNVPYGIMNAAEDESIMSLVEKPTYTYYANAGIYIINKRVLQQIPKNTTYNATDLMQQLIDDSNRLVHYPILQYWLDIGKYEDYIKAQHDFKHINF